jgi:hypothetical protein
VPLGQLLDELCAPDWRLTSLLAEDAYGVARERYGCGSHLSSAEVEALERSVAEAADAGVAAQIRARYAAVELLLARGVASSDGTTSPVRLAFDPCKEDAPTKRGLLENVLPQLNDPDFRDVFDQSVTLHE